MRLRDGKSLAEPEGEVDEEHKDINEKYGGGLETHDSTYKDKDMKSHGLQGDYGNVALLFLLYVLQGIPLGMAGSIPMILQNKKISYKEQAVFSLVFWPFSIKLLWAPIVDAVFVKSFGRRKTWLVPTQYLIGVFMLVLSAVSV